MRLTIEKILRSASKRWQARSPRLDSSSRALWFLAMRIGSARRLALHCLIQTSHTSNERKVCSKMHWVTSCLSGVKAVYRICFPTCLLVPGWESPMQIRIVFLEWKAKVSCCGRNVGDTDYMLSPKGFHCRASEYISQSPPRFLNIYRYVE